MAENFIFQTSCPSVTSFLSMQFSIKEIKDIYDELHTRFKKLPSHNDLAWTLLNKLKIKYGFDKDEVFYFYMTLSNSAELLFSEQRYKLALKHYFQVMYLNDDQKLGFSNDINIVSHILKKYPLNDENLKELIFESANELHENVKFKMDPEQFTKKIIEHFKVGSK